MEIIFLQLKRAIVFCLILFFVTVFSYTDNLFTRPILTPPVAEAGLANIAQETTQWINRIELSSIFGTTNTSAIAEVGQFALEQQENARNFILNGIAWTLAKQALSMMVSSIIDWVNSGFEGSPAFVQDLQGFLTDVLDEVAGDYINYIVGGDSFICSPFRLDIAGALNLRYSNARRGRPDNEGCSFSTIVGNVEDFLAGNFASGGGWEQWLRVTARPNTTPYGGLLEAEAELNIRLVNARNEEIEVLRWGQGFLSNEVCEVIHGAGTPRERCFISNPGAVINEQLNEALGSSFSTLIEVDEWNELVSALFGQLAQQAVTGINGLLGMSDGTGYTYSDPALTTAGVRAEATGPTTTALELVRESLADEITMRDLATNEITRITAATSLGAGTGRTASGNQRRIDSAINAINFEMIPARDKALNNIALLTAFEAELLAATITDARRQEIIQAVYNDLRPHTQREIDIARQAWSQLMN